MHACVQAYVITALQMFSLDAVNASEFLEVYKGVVPPGEFGSMLDELTSGQYSFVRSLVRVFVHSFIHSLNSLLNQIRVIPWGQLWTVSKGWLYLCSFPVDIDNAALHLSNTMQGGHLAEFQVISHDYSVSRTSLS